MEKPKYPWDGYKKTEMPEGWASPEIVAEFFAKLGYKEAERSTRPASLESRTTQGPSKEN